MTDKEEIRKLLSDVFDEKEFDMWWVRSNAALNNLPPSVFVQRPNGVKELIDILDTFGR